MPGQSLMLAAMACLPLLGAGCATTRPATFGAGRLAPELGQPEVVAGPQAGSTVALADLEDRVVVLEFWATWCSPCIDALDHWNALVERFADRPAQELFAQAYGQQPRLLTGRHRRSRQQPASQQVAVQGLMMASRLRGSQRSPVFGGVASLRLAARQKSSPDRPIRDARRCGTSGA